MTTKQEQRKTVEYLKDAGILPPDENATDYPPLEPEQVWNGESKSYTILSDDGRRIEVEIKAFTDAVSYSERPWYFTHEQFRALIAESDLKLYDAASQFDDLAERLDQLGHPALATQLDRIATGKRGVNKRSRKADEMNQDIRVLTEQLEKAKDPLNIARLTSQLAALTKDLAAHDDKTPQSTEIAPPPGIAAPNNIPRPNMITKGAADEDEDEPEDDGSPVKKRSDESTFVIGDDIIKTLSDVASRLYDLDEAGLADKVVNFLVDNIQES